MMLRGTTPGDPTLRTDLCQSSVPARLRGQQMKTRKRRKNSGPKRRLAAR